MEKCGETEKEAGLIPADLLIVKLLYNIHVVSGDSESFFVYFFPKVSGPENTYGYLIMFYCKHWLGSCLCFY